MKPPLDEVTLPCRFADPPAMPHRSLPLPAIRTIGLMQPMTWLALAWRDMARAGWISFAHGLALTLLGTVIFAVAHNRFWLLAGALSGFLVVAPVLYQRWMAPSTATVGRPGKAARTPEASSAKTELTWWLQSPG